jgi:hypothetical protein
MLSVCMCIPPIKFRTPEPIFMYFGMYIMAPESISIAYFLNLTHQFVCLYVFYLSLLGNGLVIMLPRQWIYTQQ